MMTLILAFLISVTSAALHVSIPMIEIKLLTLEAGRMTGARRVAPVPQLECTGMLCTDDLMPKKVECHNIGARGQEVQWRCDAELDNNVKFGRIEVSCEGFEFTGDWNVLVGSCGLQYELIASSSQVRAVQDYYCFRDFEWSDNPGFYGDHVPPTTNSSWKKECMRKTLAGTAKPQPKPFWAGFKYWFMWAGVFACVCAFAFIPASRSSLRPRLYYGGGSRVRSRSYSGSRSWGGRFRSSGGGGSSGGFRSYGGGSSMSSGFGGSRSR